MNWEQHSQSVLGAERPYNAPFHKLMRMFTISVLISFIGTFVGQYVPPALFMPLVVVEFVMIISSFFIRRRGRPIGYFFVYSFCFLSGVTIFPAVLAYSRTEGSSLVSSAFLLTGLIFAGLTVYAYFSKRDFSFLRGFLLVGLLVLIGFSLIGMFTNVYTGTMGLMIAAGGVLIFSGYILYDVSQYRHGVPDEMIPLAVLNLYLDFINLFLYVLRLLGLSRD